MRGGPRLERSTHTVLTLAFQGALVVVCLLLLEHPLLFILGALSEGLVLLLLLLVMLLVALTALLLGLATLVFEDSELLLLSRAPLHLSDVVRLSFPSLGHETLLFEKGFAVEAVLFLSAQFFVETDLLLSFPLKCLFLAPLLQVSLFLEALLLLQKARFHETLLL